MDASNLSPLKSILRASFWKGGIKVPPRPQKRATGKSEPLRAISASRPPSAFAILKILLLQPKRLRPSKIKLPSHFLPLSKKVP